MATRIVAQPVAFESSQWCPLLVSSLTHSKDGQLTTELGLWHGSNGIGILPAVRMNSIFLFHKPFHVGACVGGQQCLWDVLLPLI